MALTLVAERREPSGRSAIKRSAAERLAPLRYIGNPKVSTIGRRPPEPLGRRMLESRRTKDTKHSRRGTLLAFMCLLDVVVRARAFLRVVER